MKHKSKTRAKTHDSFIYKNPKIPKILAGFFSLLGDKFSLGDNKAVLHKSEIVTLFSYIAIPQANKALSTTDLDDVIFEKSKKK